MNKEAIEHTNEPTTESNSEQHSERVEDVLERIGVPIHTDRLRSRFGEHVQVHKYFLDRRHKADTDWREAAASWNVNVFEPLREAVEAVEVKSLFPGRKPEDLVAEVSDHWHFLKQVRPDVSPREAAESFARSHGNRVARFLGAPLFGRAVRRWKAGSRRADRIDENLKRFRASYDANSAHWPL